MIKIYKVLTLAFTLFVLTLSVAAQKTKASAPDYFPLRVGDSWKYRSIGEDFEFTTKVVSAEKQADGTTLYLVEKLAGVKIDDWYSRTDGWVLMHREAYPEQPGLDVKYQPARQYLKNPLVAGAKWNWKGKSVTQTEGVESNEIIGTETVEVPAGRFRAMKVVGQVSDGGAIKTRTSWYANGVGLVKSTTEAGQLKYGFELVDYSFKKTSPKK